MILELMYEFYIAGKKIFTQISFKTKLSQKYSKENIWETDCKKL